LTTTIGTSINLFFMMIDCTVRAKISVPPPAPLVTMNSTGFSGTHAALATAA
jgi:hypothetical protein